MTKSATTQSEQTGTKPTETISGAFRFEGHDDVINIGIEFVNWCKEMSEKYQVTLLSERHDYNNNPATDRTR